MAGAAIGQRSLADRSSFAPLPIAFDLLIGLLRFVRAPGEIAATLWGDGPPV